MSIAIKSDNCGRDEQAVKPVGKSHPNPECGDSSPETAIRNPDLSISGLRKSAESEQPRLQTFEELSIADNFRQAVEAELTKGEKIIWIGRPSKNPAVYPDTKFVLAAIGAVLVGFAVLLGAFGLAPWFMAVFFGLFGCLFFGFYYLVRTGKFNPATTYKACYVVTNRRAMLIEPGTVGLEPGLFNPASTRCKSWYPHELLGLEARKHATVDKAGELVFEYIFVVGKAVTSFPGTTGTIQRTDTPQRVARGFFYLDRVREVEQVVRDTLLTNLEKNVDAPAPSVENAKPSAKIARPSTTSVAKMPTPSANAAAMVDASTDSDVQECREDGEIPAAIKEKILAELDPKERLVWIAQPVAAIVFRRSLAYLAVGGIVALISLAWLGTGLLPKKQATPVAAGKKGAAPQVKTPPPAGNPFNSLPIIFLIGSLGGMAVPVVRWKLAQGTCYALTNRRALVYKAGLFGPTRESYSPMEVAQMRRSDSWVFQDGGDLIFRSVTTVTTYSKGRPSVRTTHYGFLSIAHVKEIDRLVRETLIDRFVDKLQAANAI